MREECTFTFFAEALSIMNTVCYFLTVHPVKFTDRDAFSTSHYHIADAVVEKATIFEKVCCLKY
jgi:hypothetical protein